MPDKQTVWVVSGHSESGDDYPVMGVYSSKPSEAFLRNLAHDFDGDEDGDGPGDYGSYMYLTVEECEVEDAG